MSASYSMAVTSTASWSTYDSTSAFASYLTAVTYKAKSCTSDSSFASYLTAGTTSTGSGSM